LAVLSQLNLAEADPFEGVVGKIDLHQIWKIRLARKGAFWNHDDIVALCLKDLDGQEEIRHIRPINAVYPEFTSQTRVAAVHDIQQCSV
jgi:hypothetical protein